MTAHDMTVVFTDGACAGNPGRGGWAWAVAPEGRPCGSGGAAHTTNQRMELQAVLEALRSLPGQLTIVSDSTYVVHCFCDKWWVKWTANGWKNSQKQPVKNVDLWQRLDAAVNRHNVSWEWVKGHNGHPENERADELANRGVMDPEGAQV